MSIDRVLPYIVVGLTTLLLGVMLGVWAGSSIEQNAIVTIVTRAKLTPECRAALNEAVKEIISDYEGKSARPAAEQP